MSRFIRTSRLTSFFKTIFGKIVFGVVATNILVSSSVGIVHAARFGDALENATSSLSGTIDMKYNGTQGGLTGVNAAIIDVLRKVVTPLIIIGCIVSAIVGMYKVISSDKEDATKDGMNYIIWGVLGIIIITTANFLATTLVKGGIFTYDINGEFLGNITAQKIYNKMIFPFLKTGMYLVIGALFIITIFRLIEFIQSPKDDVKKQAKTILQRNALGIIVIIFAKNIVEALYGTEAQITAKNATDLGGIGGAVDKGLPFMYTIINYAMGFIGLFMLVVIIVQAVKLLINPTDEGNQKSIRKNFIYIIIGLVIIGTSYVVVNTLIVN